jgi:hypothetical protein
LVGSRAEGTTKLTAVELVGSVPAIPVPVALAVTRQTLAAATPDDSIRETPQHALPLIYYTWLVLSKVLFS